MYTLAEVRNKYQDGVDLRTAAWVLNRMLEVSVLANDNDLVIAGITPDTFMIDTNNHNGVLLSWYSAVRVGSTGKFVFPNWKQLYPSEVRSKLKLTSTTDIYMAVRCFLYLLGFQGDSYKYSTKLPRSVINFINYCLLGHNSRPSDPVSVHMEFSDILKRVFGEPKFHQGFSMP
jgi:hypothetical protein